MNLNTISLDGADEPLGREVRRSVRSVLRKARSDRSVVLLTGGPGAWEQHTGPEDVSLARDELHPLALSLLGHPGAVVGYAQGRVSGVGLALFLACDVRLSASDATYSIGPAPALTALVTGSYRLLQHRVGRSVADELAWTGTVLSAAEARAAGLTTTTMMTEERARLLAEDLVSVGPATVALKRASLAGGLQPLTEQLRYDSWLTLACGKG